jgi:hypothetical protein
MTISKNEFDGIMNDVDKRMESYLPFIKAQIDNRVEHLDSSPNTIKSLERLEGNVMTLDSEMKNKVGWKQFFWIVGLLTTFMTAMLAAIWFQVRVNGDLANTTHHKVSFIEGVLSNPNNTIEYVD